MLPTIGSHGVAFFHHADANAATVQRRPDRGVQRNFSVPAGVSQVLLTPKSAHVAVEPRWTNRVGKP